jgi:hypothetical protein
VLKALRVPPVPPVVTTIFMVWPEAVATHVDVAVIDPELVDPVAQRNMASDDVRPLDPTPLTVPHPATTDANSIAHVLTIAKAWFIDSSPLTPRRTLFHTPREKCLRSQERCVRSLKPPSKEAFAF